MTIQKKNSNGTFTKKYLDEYRDKVEKMSQLGCTDKEISHILEMHMDSLKKHYRAELDFGRSNLRKALRKAQIELAVVEKNPTMLIWLGKNYLDQREPKHTLEHSGGFTVEKVIFGSKQIEGQNGKVDES